MTKKKLIWPNSSLSGLCDRLIDLHLMAALAEILDRQLILEWKKTTELNDFQRVTWSSARQLDYLVENFTRYFYLPRNIRFVKLISDEIDDSCVFFNHYLGGVYSPKTFFDKYCGNFCTYESFENIYYKKINEFKPTSKLLDLIGILPEINISVHLRRGDKVTSDPDFVQIHTTELSDLEILTGKCFSDQLSKYQPRNPNVFICSDSELAKKSFIENNCSSCNVIDINNQFYDYEKTYIDIFLLSISDVIILSQRHSNFSLFSSLINKKKLIYLYESKLIGDGAYKNCERYLI